MNLTAKLIPLALASAAALACAQTTTVPAQPSATTTPTDISPEIRTLLQMLHDRKATLKDFTAKIDNSVEHIAGDKEGTLGTVDYIDDSAAGGGGTKFSVHFTTDTEEGKPKYKHDRDIIFDGKTFTIVDYKVKSFHQQTPEKPANPNSFDSELPVPIGIPPATVAQDFNVTLLPSKDPNLATLRLVPRVKGRVEYTQLDLTIDKKLQLPIQVVSTAKGGDVTTIKFLDPQINTGKAKIASNAPPKDPGWTIEIK
jgi:outer membrane lipoprotein-sorting protein